MLCPKCGQTNGETAPYCIYCGQMLRVVDISTPPAMSSPGTGGSRSAIPVNPPRVAPPRPQPGVPSLPTGAPLPPEYVSPPGYLPQCRVCGTRITPKLYQCPRCGTPVGSIANPYDATSATYLPTGVPYMPVGGVAPIISNTSGQRSPVPPELQGGWNWGAAFVTFFWAIAHQVWWYFGYLAAVFAIAFTLGFLATMDPGLQPLVSVFQFLRIGVGIYLLLYFGRHGNEMAWKYRRFENAQHCQLVQSKWAPWGKILFGIIVTCIMLLLLAVLIGGVAMLKD